MNVWMNAAKIISLIHELKITGCLLLIWIAISLPFKFSFSGWGETKYSSLNSLGGMKKLTVNKVECGEFERGHFFPSILSPGLRILIESKYSPEQKHKVKGATYSVAAAFHSNFTAVPSVSVLHPAHLYCYCVSWLCVEEFEVHQLFYDVY